MPIVDSRTGREQRYDADQLVEAAREMRALNILAIHAARSGHPGGTLSIMDVAAALFLNEARLDPRRPDWEGRDRVFFSAGHKAPTLYVAMAKAGFFKYEDVVTLRKVGSAFQGHPHAPGLAGVEVSSGSLGQGLGISVGVALAARLDQKDSRIYCVMGDGEQQEGSIWEAVMAAGQYHLMEVEPLDAKYKAFGWHTVRIDGHDMRQILAAFNEARHVSGKPTVILAHTVKGKGVSFMENQLKFHGSVPDKREQIEQALREIQGAPIESDVR
jgi:transketolase